MSSAISHDSWSCHSSVFKQVLPILFDQGGTDHEMTELINMCEIIDANPKFHDNLQTLLVEQKQGYNIQIRLHQLLLCSIYPLHIQKILNFHISEDCLPTVHGLMDIGHIVRRLLLKWHSSNILYRLYQYSMPFIKHNRLNFPSLRNLDMTILKHMTLAIFLTCLGAHSSDSKTPVWQVTRQLFVFFNNLTTKGSAADMYIFLERHIYLLRIALIEHFISFTNKYMQTEVLLMPYFVDKAYQHTRVSKQLQYITDTFRQTTLQQEKLNWDFIETKAQLAIERCNRTCKAMPNFKTSVRCVQRVVWDSEAITEGLSMPRLNMFDILNQSRDVDILALAQIAKLHSYVKKYPLPLYLQNQQYEAVLRNSNMNTGRNILSRTKAFICLQCNALHPIAKKDMRYNYMQKSICTNCLQAEFVLEIETLGHLVKVNTNYYYFCHFCYGVHKWQSTGCEFCSCPKQDKLVAFNNGKHCAICYRTMHLYPLQILDKKLGVMQHLYLCSKHMPNQEKMKYVYDLGALRRLVDFSS